MSCFHPIDAWRVNNDTKLDFTNKPAVRKHHTEHLRVPCGKCIGCLLDRANDWATRCWCEAQEWDNNCFITLTYNNENLPEDSNLRIKDLQDFWKRLRYYEKGKQSWINPQNGKKENPIRYYACGEYGGKKYRPHYHACVFNWKPDDLRFYKENHNGDRLFISKKLTKIWGKGFVIVGNLTYQSACYVARYVSKKMFKKSEIYKLIRKTKEFTVCSSNSGIGLNYWKKFKTEIINNNGIWIKIGDTSKNKKIPKYFMRKWEQENDDDFEFYKLEKMKNGQKIWNEILSKTDLSELEYLKKLEDNLLEKAKILKRDNLI